MGFRSDAQRRWFFANLGQSRAGGGRRKKGSLTKKLLVGGGIVAGVIAAKKFKVIGRTGNVVKYIKRGQKLKKVLPIRESRNIQNSAKNITLPRGARRATSQELKTMDDWNQNLRTPISQERVLKEFKGKHRDVVEQIIPNSKREIALYFNKNGRVIDASPSNSVNSASLPDSVLRNEKITSMTHNHPGDATFSEADMTALGYLNNFNSNMKEIRAVTKTHTYSLSVKQTGTPSGKQGLEDFMKNYGLGLYDKGVGPLTNNSTSVMTRLTTLSYHTGADNSVIAARNLMKVKNGTITPMSGVKNYLQSAHVIARSHIKKISGNGYDFKYSVVNRKTNLDVTHKNRLALSADYGTPQRTREYFVMNSGFVPKSFVKDTTNRLIIESGQIVNKHRRVTK